ncbi:MAG: AzlC family ABC transporter permease [Thermoanaerobacteraceae bacterium]|nr:AzlC family ABC transporter permease [Thermoanaerobacteraceae bacterium]
MQSCKKDEFVFGIKRALPIVMGYMPVGFALGVMAADAGLNPLQMGLMSLFVYAGSAQFIAVDMLGSGISAIPIIATTLLVNLRHFLFSASLAPYFREIKQRFIPFISFFITDESFAVSITDAKQRPFSHIYFFSLYITSYSAWVLSTIMGSALGNLITNTKALGFDFALPGMFLALLCMQLNNFKFVLIALISGFLSILFLYTIPGNWNVILATILAAMIGVFIGDEN